MNNELEVSFEGDHIAVVANGEKDLEFAERVFTAMRDACVEHNCFRVLGIGFTTVPQSTSDGFENAKLWARLGLTGRYRVARVEVNPSAVQNAQFIETVLVNRGFSVRLFSDVEQARAWLGSDDA